MNCNIEDCNKKAEAKGMCSMHYKRMYRLTPKYIQRYGLHKSRRAKIVENITKDNIYVLIQDNTDFTDGCWIWNGEKTINGYARLRRRGKIHRLHRLMYTVFIGNPDEDLVLDHLCETKLCINPFHLEQVTIGENLRRYWKNRKN